MFMTKMTLSQELEWRGLINQTTLEDISDLDDKTWTFYHGFDASADSQAIGNLAAMMIDAVFMRHGHKAILLAGGATSLVGDPGGKDKERPMQSEETIHANVKAAEQQLKRIFSGQEFTLVNNLDWFKDINILSFLRDTGKYFGMSTLVQRDYIQQRIGEGGSGMSFTEFSYTLMQGYDFNYLHEKYGVNLQLSGSDQWGNCLSGVDLVRKVNGVTVHALTMPLVINKATGRKFGKSEEGAVWLDESKTSVFEFYQFWLNVDDGGAGDYLKIYTSIMPDEYEKLMSEFNKTPHQRSAQKYLAHSVTSLVHGQQRADDVTSVSQVLFGEKDFTDLTESEVAELAKVLSVVKGETIADALIASELAGSKSEVRRFIESKAIKVNNSVCSDGGADIADLDVHHGYVLLRRGKNKFALVEPKS